jgi:hypothetical protein
MKLLHRLGPVLLLVLGACASAKEPARVELPLVTDSSGLTLVTTDLGYAVEVTEARALLRDFTFATAGEAHAARPWLRLLPVARAHPGHFAGGAVTGELRGRFIADFTRDGLALGVATLLVGEYSSVSFVFARASTEDVADDDLLLGHTAILRGSASREGASVDFTFILDSPDDRALVGAPFEMHVTEETSASIGVRLLTFDARSETTLFDGLDFFALDGDEDGLLVVDPASSSEAAVDAYNRLLRTFQTHDRFDAIPVPAAE